MEARVCRSLVRLLRHELRRDRSARRHSMAASRWSRSCRDKATLYRRPLSDRRRQGTFDRRRMGTLPRTADGEFSSRAEYGAHDRALAYTHENRRGADSRALVADPLGGNESARCAEAAAAGAGSGRRRFAPRAYSQPGAQGHGDRRARSGVRAFSLGDRQRQPGDAEQLRPNLTRTQLQAERRASRASPMKKLVVVGNGMAGARVVEEILKRAPDRFDIVMFGAEPYGNYNRILLSNVLNGTQSAPDIFMNPLSWYRENGVTLHAGVRATRIDRERRVVVGRQLKKSALAYAADAACEQDAALIEA